jgi:hypothetical protein
MDNRLPDCDARSDVTDELPDREPLSEREIKRVTLEIAIGVVLWVGFVLLVLELPNSLGEAVAVGGGIAVALAIGWWRIIRFGPEGPPRREP